MSRSVPLLLVLSGALFLGASEGERRSPADDVPERPLVLTVRLVDEAISPGVDRYVQRAIRAAEEREAECLVILLDTPGGLVSSTRSIVKAFLASRTCVVVYVSPSGGRAASAGVFITLAGHVAAMTPGTTIGAAHPVQLGGLPFQPPSQEPAREPASDQQKAEEDEQQEAEDSEDGKQPAEKDKSDRPEEKPGDSADETEEPSADAPPRSRSPRSPMEEKIVNDTVAWARSLARLRDRNEDWAARAVRQSISVPAEEAVEERVVDLLAEDLDELLEKLDGREISLPEGPHKLATADARVEDLPMWWGETVLAMLSRPNVAFLLMLFGFYGILFEFYSPGWGVAGTLGVICLLLGMFGLAVLPVNYLGLALILVALALFVAEVFVTSFGALALGGIVCLVLGGLMLVDSPVGFARVSPMVVIPLAVATALIVVFLVGGIVRAHRRKPTTGDEGLAGATAEAKGDFSRQGDRYVGTVFVHGEWWRAASDAPIAAGQPCRVEDRQGLTLTVAPLETGVSET